MEQKIYSLPQRVSTVLKLMACFPSTIVDLSFLETTRKGLNVDEFQDDSGAACDLIDVLKEATQEGLVEMVEPKSCRFTHDRVRESAYSLIAEGQPRAQNVPS